jgi:hypothetical protein
MFSRKGNNYIMKINICTRSHVPNRYSNSRSVAISHNEVFLVTNSDMLSSTSFILVGERVAFS